jgi:outer membrane protein assembly factor BamB
MTNTSKGIGVTILTSLVLLSAAPKTPVGWRTDGTGLYTKATPPTRWAEDKNVVWKTKLPGRSQGSPILVGDRIFVVSDPAELICINASDGEIMWRRSNELEDLYGPDKAKEITDEYARLKKERHELERDLNKAKGDEDKQKEIKKRLDAANKIYREWTKRSPAPPSNANGETTNSAATPSSDGKQVYAVFGNGIVCAYTVAGERQWIKFLEMPTIGFGHTASPALAGEKLIVHLNNLFALEAATGEIAWQMPLTARYASPIITEVGDKRVVLSPAGAVLRVSDGKVLLKDGSLSTSECSPVLHDGILYAIPGGARAVRLAAKGDDAVKLEKIWEKRTAGGRRTPSPVLHNGLLYGVTTDGILEVLDASTGELVYQQRLGIGSVYSSATAAGDYVYLSGTNGTTLVIAAGKEYKEEARNKLEGFGSCPIFSGSHMFVRTRGHLYCIGQ